MCRFYLESGNRPLLVSVRTTWPCMVLARDELKLRFSDKVMATLCIVGFGLISIVWFINLVLEISGTKTTKSMIGTPPPLKMSRAASRITKNLKMPCSKPAEISKIPTFMAMLFGQVWPFHMESTIHQKDWQGLPGALFDEMRLLGAS